MATSNSDLNVQDILDNFVFRNQIPRLSKANALGTLIRADILETETETEALLEEIFGVGEPAYAPELE
jgi:hypothetical protein